MSEFNVGDKVKVVSGIFSRIPVGTEGTVRSISDNGNYFRVELSRHTTTVPFLADEIEVVDEIKVGDKVRVLNPDEPTRAYVKVGAIGTVKRLPSIGGLMTTVLFQGSDSSDHYYGEEPEFTQVLQRSQLELVTEEAKPSFKIGDRVKLTRKTNPGVYVPLGTKGTVTEDTNTWDDGTYDGRVEFDGECGQWVKWDQVELIVEAELVEADVTALVREQAVLHEDIAQFLYDAADLKDREVELRERADELGMSFA